MLEKPVLPAAAIFYILYVFGLIFLVLKPAIDANSVINAIWLGGVFGLVAYGTYDLTNLATIRGWSVTVTLVDMLWGAFLTDKLDLFLFLPDIKTLWLLQHIFWPFQPQCHSLQL